MAASVALLQRFKISAVLWKACSLVDAKPELSGLNCGVAIAAASDIEISISCSFVSPRTHNMLRLYV